MKHIIIYDFDGTLTPYPLPQFKILEKCGCKGGACNPTFLKMAKEKVKNENMDLDTALYETYFQIIRESELPLIDENFCLGAKEVIYNKGVANFLNFLNENGVQNFCVSTGLKVYLEKTSIANLFTRIYATTFVYNDKKEVTGIQYLMSAKNKAETIKDIMKKMGNKKDDCQNIIYIGDGFTDYYAMKYVKENGGTSICVYQDDNNPDIERLEKENVLSFKAYANFEDNSELSQYIKKRIAKKIMK